MRSVHLVCLLASLPVVAAPPAPVDSYRSAAELREAIRTAAPGGDAVPQHGLYSLRLSPPSEAAVIGIRRTQAGKAELHQKFSDVWLVVDGAATLVVGGTLVDDSEAAPGEMRGNGIAGGRTRRVRAGDYLVIPAGTPHWISRTEGAGIMYVVVKTPGATPAGGS